MATKPAKQTKIQEAYARCKEARDHLAVKLHARLMENLEDKKFGIVNERWLLPNGRSVMLMSTPDWWDVYRPVSDSGRIDLTIAAIDSFSRNPKGE